MKIVAVEKTSCALQLSPKEFSLAYHCLLEAWTLLSDNAYRAFFGHSAKRGDALMRNLRRPSKSQVAKLTLEEAELLYQAVFVTMSGIYNWEFPIRVGFNYSHTKREALRFADALEPAILEMLKNRADQE